MFFFEFNVEFDICKKIIICDKISIEVEEKLCCYVFVVGKGEGK